MNDPLHPKRQLAEILLDQSLEEWVAERRSDLGWKSWDRMARELRAVTDGRVVLAGNTLRRWFPQYVRGAENGDGETAA